MSDNPPTPQPASPKISPRSEALGFGLLAVLLAGLILTCAERTMSAHLSDRAADILAGLLTLGFLGGAYLWRRRAKRKWLLVVFLLLWATLFGLLQDHIRQSSTRWSPRIAEVDGIGEIEIMVEERISAFSINPDNALKTWMKFYVLTIAAALGITLALGFALRQRDRRKLAKETL